MAAIAQGSASVGLNYDNSNRRTCLALPSGVMVSYGYDTDSRLTSLTYGTGGSCTSPPSNLGTLTYAYDATSYTYQPFGATTVSGSAHAWIVSKRLGQFRVCQKVTDLDVLQPAATRPLEALQRVLAHRFAGETLERNLRLVREAAARVPAGSWKDASHAPGN